jgi:hypothetical protein
MRLRAELRRGLLALAFLGCGKSGETAAPERVVACDSSAIVAGFDDVANVRVHVDPGIAPDLEGLLAQLWHQGFTVDRSAPPSSGPAISISSRDAAGIDAGYAIKRTGDRISVSAANAADLNAGAYALLEVLGIRFFHPKQTFVPALKGPRLPKTLDIRRRAAFATRGLQVHTLHPIEYLPALLQPGEQNLADAKTLIDWIVHTGQNHLQWVILNSIPVDQWRPHVAKIVDYAHARNVTIGAVAALSGSGSLQGGYALVNDKATWQTQMEQKLDELLVVPFDLVEVSMGEFFASDPEAVVTWLDHGTNYLATKYPKTAFSVINHLGNQPAFFFDFRGDKNVFFYHVPGYADPRLINNVHTVYLFDLYRPWGAYGHPDFSLHREFIFRQLPKRKVRYFPESAYWASADVDVPLFLPEYIHARWTDVHNLDKDVRAKALPPLDGHILYSSGHEWGYWLTDYLTAKILWEPSRTFDSLLTEYTSTFGSCAGDVQSTFRSFVALQTELLFDKKLVPYLAGEDSHDDFAAGSVVTIPERVPFHKASTLDPAILVGLDDYAKRSAPLLEEIVARCRGADAALKPWCEELRDGIEIDMLRARHTAALYRAVLGQASLDAARAITTEAAKVIARRGGGYRFPVETLARAGKTETIYPFGYLRQAHTQCFWRRREEQVAWILENGEPPPLGKVASCQE